MRFFWDVERKSDKTKAKVVRDLCPSLYLHLFISLKPKSNWLPLFFLGKLLFRAYLIQQRDIIDLLLHTYYNLISPEEWTLVWIWLFGYLEEWFVMWVFWNVCSTWTLMEVDRKTAGSGFHSHLFRRETLLNSVASPKQST